MNAIKPRTLNIFLTVCVIVLLGSVYGWLKLRTSMSIKDFESGDYIIVFIDSTHPKYRFSYLFYGGEIFCHKTDFPGYANQEYFSDHLTADIRKGFRRWIQATGDIYGSYTSPGPMMDRYVFHTDGDRKSVV